MVDKLYTQHDRLVTPNDRLTASSVCCCPSCIICEDSFERSNNSNINTGAPMIWAGGTSDFTINGNRLRTVVSGAAVTGCSGDRVTVSIKRTNSGGTYTTSQASVKLGSVIATITFPSSAGEPGRIAITGGGVNVGTVNYVDVPEIVNEAQITLCVRQIRPYNDTEIGLLGVHLYSAHGNKTVSGYIGSTAFDPDAGTYGTSGLGTGTIDTTHSQIFFIDFKVQHLRGAEGDDYEACPQCRPRPCYASSDGGFDPLGTTSEGKWTVLSGTWPGGPISTVAYSTVQSDALKFDGYARGGFIECTVAHYSTDTNTRIYMTRAGAGSALSAADYVELVPPRGHQQGCVRLMRQASVLAAVPWEDVDFPSDIYCIYGAGVWYVAVSGAPGILIGPLSLQPFEPAIGVGAAPVSGGGIEIYGATIGHTAEDGYSYCTRHTAACAVYDTSGLLWTDAAATLPNCQWNVLSGSWSWVDTDSTGYVAPTTTSANAYIQRQQPYPTLAAGGCFEATIGFRNVSDIEDLFGAGLKWGWDGGNSRVVVRFQDPDTYLPLAPRGMELTCAGNKSVYTAELWLGGAKVDEVGPFSLCWGLDFRMKICLGQGVVRVSDAQNGITLFRHATDDFGSDPYWGVGVEDMPAGVKFRVAVMSLNHTRDQQFDYLPSTMPSNCEMAFTPYIIAGSVCAGSDNLPTMLKIVTTGITSFDPMSCSCDDANGIFFLLPDYIATYAGSGQARYSFPLPPNDPATCTRTEVQLVAVIGTNFVYAGFEGVLVPGFAQEWQYNDFSTPPYSCLEDLVDLSLPPINSSVSCDTSSSTLKVTTIR